MMGSSNHTIRGIVLLYIDYSWTYEIKRYEKYDYKREFVLYHKFQTRFVYYKI